jgi:hypothetical protein
MNFGILVLLIVVSWSLVSIVASLAVGDMAKAPDVAPTTAIRAWVPAGATVRRRKPITPESRELAS